MSLDAKEVSFVATPEKGRVSGLLIRPPSATSLVVLGHGASSNLRSPLMRSIAEALAAESVATFRYNFPYSENGRGRDSNDVCVATVRSAVAAAREMADDMTLFAGGHSFGGRMTSTAASEAALDGVAGLVFFGFPLHPAGRPGTERAAHLSRVSVPMLFLSGDRDQLAEPDLFRPVVSGLGRNASLHIIETADHSFKVLKRSRTSSEDPFAEAARVFREWSANLEKN